MRGRREERRKQNITAYVPGDIVVNDLETTFWLTEDINDIENFERLPRQTLLTIIAAPKNERYVKVLIGTQTGWVDVEDIGNPK